MDVKMEKITGIEKFPVGPVFMSAMTLDTAKNRVLDWVKTGARHYVNVCAVENIVKCAKNPELAKIVNNAEMTATDGMPLVWLAHYYGFKNATRVYGPDLMLALCSATAGAGSSAEAVSHFFYGGTPEVLEKLKTNLLKKYPGLKIAGMYAPPFRPLTEDEKKTVIEMINNSGAGIVWCGLGTPKQDYWVAEFRPHLNAAALLSVGAAFNFHAGTVKQAPRWMMRCGLEWFFRLLMEPRRLWKRYLIGNFQFIFIIVPQLFRGRKILEK